LEHHTNCIIESGDEKKDERIKLASENWDYPIIITTAVQFFESLFSNRSFKCRKVHNISNSVVIFDEVQTLPKEVVSPTLTILENMRDIMHTSFLFCTATQPAFEKRRGFNGIDNIIPLIENPRELYEKTKRVKYKLLNDLKPVDYEYLSKSINDINKSSLVVFNTKKCAAEFYSYFSQFGNWDSLYHLSNSMCPSHRQEVITQIREDLKCDKKILVVSTQLIEAGVDFDFPVVFRAIAPLESIIQAAGRCNREGKLGEMGGDVYIFKLEDNPMPDKTYGCCAGYAEEIIISNLDTLYESDVFKKYYADVIHLYSNPDKYNISKYRNHFNFELVNDSYNVIQSNTIGLYINHYNEDSQNLLDSVKDKEHLSREDYRNMQRFTVQVYGGFITENNQFINKMQQGFYVWVGEYDSKLGLPSDHKKLDVLIS
jgi:CRISPR-associated endonuclease/helicase Cas3